nr:MFS transporter [Frigoriglobus tundricola]
MDHRLLVLALGMFALGTDSFVVAGILPQVARGFDISVGAAGQMTTVYAISYALLSPTVAALAAGVPRKRLLLAALTVFVVANVGTAAAPTFGIALATRALAGLGAAMFAPTATGVATLLVPPNGGGSPFRSSPPDSPPQRPWARRSGRSSGPLVTGGGRWCSSRYSARPPGSAWRSC